VIDQITKDSLTKHLMKVVILHMVKFNIKIVPIQVIIIFKEAVEEVIIKEEVTVEVLPHLVVVITKEVVIL
jgi:hypothetical protein